jgi:hypothetical protein
MLWGLLEGRTSSTATNGAAAAGGGAQVLPGIVLMIDKSTFLNAVRKRSHICPNILLHPKMSELFLY